MKTLSLSVCLLLSLMAVACGEEDPASDPPVDPRAEPMPELYPSCKNTRVEPDAIYEQPAMGPAVNPNTGAIEPPAGAIVSITYLALKPSDAAAMRFGQLVGGISQQLGVSQGLLAVHTSYSPSCNTARTLTVWQDQAAMMAFVTSAPHMEAIAATAQVSRGSSITQSWPHTGGAVTWSEAVARLETHRGMVY